jgi:hypothetical protein
MDNETIRIDGVKWWKTKNAQGWRTMVPLCPDHHIRLSPSPYGRVTGNNGRMRDMLDSEARKLKCEEGPHFFDIPRSLSDEKNYVVNRIDAKIFEKMDTIDLDGELTPVAKAKDKSDKYFATAQIMESRRGLQVVVYAGEKGKKSKSQIIIDAKNKKLSFDHKDISPTDVFLEVKATFDDGTTQTIKQKENK